MDAFSKILWFTHRKYYRKSKREIWEYLSIVAGVYLIVYYVVCCSIFGIWLYASAERPSYIIGPAFPKLVQGIRFTGIFHVVTGICSLVTVSFLFLSMCYKNIQYVTATTILLNLIVLLDLMLIILLFLYWDKLAAIKIIFTIITHCCWFIVDGLRKLIKRETLEKQRQLKLNPFHSRRYEN